MALDKVIVTILLTVTAVITAGVISAAVIPAVGQGAGALSSASATITDRIKTDIAIIHASGDTTNKLVYGWVKNTGVTTIDSITTMDVFLLGGGNFDRIPYGTGAGTWTYSLTGGAAAWSPTTTIKITITLSSLSAGVYNLVVVTPNGMSARHTFSV